MTSIPPPFFLLILPVMILLSGCQSPDAIPLMPTPVLYFESGVSALDRVPVEEQWTSRKIYFATNRLRDPDFKTVKFGNGMADHLSLGLGLVEFGDGDLTWQGLTQASKEAVRPHPIPLSISGLLYAGRTRPVTETGNSTLPGWWLHDLNQTIKNSRSKDLLIYVHGAKVDFYNASAFTAQIDHFMGRDMTSLAYAWPSRQDIVRYASGADVKRAYSSSLMLSSLIEFIASESEAEKIHILCWSAGGRVVSSAVTDLRSRFSHLSEEEFRQTFRIGTLYFAAAEVPRAEFVDVLPGLEEAAQRVVVTATTHDRALQNARFMGEGVRLGQLSDGLTPEQVKTLTTSEKLEVVDVSLGSEARGFTITGHRYWFDHPWVSSDIMLAIRWGLSPVERGLESTESGIVWGFSPDYPTRISRVHSAIHKDVKVPEVSEEYPKYP